MKSGLSIIFILLLTSNFASLNFEAWGEEGPNGGYFEYDGYEDYSFSSYPCRGQSIHRLKRYYLYGGATIGEFLEADTIKYFISDIGNCYLEIFDDKDEWLGKIEAKGLSPLIWTRWHKGHWNWFNPENTVIFMFFPFLGILLLIIFMILMILNIFQSIKHFSSGNASKKSRKSVILISLNLGILTLLLLNLFPGSI